MAMTSKTVAKINETVQHLQVSPERLAELPVELAQFADVIARVRHRVAFDQDPADLLGELRRVGAQVSVKEQR